MAIFTIIVSENRDVVLQKIKEQYQEGSSHETADGYFFVSDSGTTQEVAKKVGLYADNPPAANQPVGVVIKTEYISGYYYESLWEWTESRGTLSDES